MLLPIKSTTTTTARTARTTTTITATHNNKNNNSSHKIVHPTSPKCPPVVAGNSNNININHNHHHPKHKKSSSSSWEASSLYGRLRRRYHHHGHSRRQCGRRCGSCAVGCGEDTSTTGTTTTGTTTRRRYCGGGGWPPPSVLWVILIIGLPILLLSIAFIIHRTVAWTLTTKEWAPAPILFVERECWTGNNNEMNHDDSYETKVKANNNNSNSSSSNSNIIQKKPKICMTTLTDQQAADGWQRLFHWRNFDSLLEMTWPNKEAYCRKHGYTLYDSSFLLDSSRPPSWSKIKAARYGLVTLRCDWVVWLDADTVIMNSQKRLEDILPVSATTNSSSNLEYDFVVTKQKEISFNAGAWMIRNSPWSLQFLDTWWKMESFVRIKGLSVSGDNDALYRYLTHDLPPSEFQTHVFVPPRRCTLNSVTKWISPSQALDFQRFPESIQEQEWYLHDEYYHKGDLIAHVAGRNNKIDTTKQLLQYAT